MTQASLKGQQSRLARAGTGDSGGACPGRGEGGERRGGALGPVDGGGVALRGRPSLHPPPAPRCGGFPACSQGEQPVIPPNLTVCRAGTPGHSATLLFVWPEALPEPWPRRPAGAVHAVLSVLPNSHHCALLLPLPPARRCPLPPGTRVPGFPWLCLLPEAPPATPSEQLSPSSVA